jgi:hypothetical protein
MQEILALPHLLDLGLMFRSEEQEAPALRVRVQGQPMLHFLNLVVVMKMLLRIVRLGRELVAMDFHWAR